MQPVKENRWLVAAAAIVTQVCLGAVLRLERLRRAAGVRHRLEPDAGVVLTLTLAIACLGVGTIVGGLWLDRSGPRPVVTPRRPPLRRRATCSPHGSSPDDRWSAST